MGGYVTYVIHELFTTPSLHLSCGLTSLDCRTSTFGSRTHSFGRESDQNNPGVTFARLKGRFRPKCQRERVRPSPRGSRLGFRSYLNTQTLCSGSSSSLPPPPHSSFLLLTASTSCLDRDDTRGPKVDGHLDLRCGVLTGVLPSLTP